MTKKRVTACQPERQKAPHSNARHGKAARTKHDESLQSVESRQVGKILRAQLLRRPLLPLQRRRAAPQLRPSLIQRYQPIV